MNKFTLKDLQILEALIPLAKVNFDKEWATIKDYQVVEMAKTEINAEVYKLTLHRNDESYFMQTESPKAFKAFCLSHNGDLNDYKIDNLIYNVKKALEEEIEKRWEEDTYWIIGTNKWSKESFTKKEAEALSKTLTNCENCIDCSHCEDCVNCEDLHFCCDCKDSNVCYHSYKLENCSGCTASSYLKDCRDVKHSSYLEGEIDSTHNKGTK